MTAAPPPRSFAEVRRWLEISVAERRALARNDLMRVALVSQIRQLDFELRRALEDLSRDSTREDRETDR